MLALEDALESPYIGRSYRGFALKIKLAPGIEATYPQLHGLWNSWGPELYEELPESHSMLLHLLSLDVVNSAAPHSLAPAREASFCLHEPFDMK